MSVRVLTAHLLHTLISLSCAETKVPVTVVPLFLSVVPRTTETSSSAKEFVFRRTPSKVLFSLKGHADDPFILSFSLSLFPFLFFEIPTTSSELFHEHSYCSNISPLTDRACPRTKEREERTSSLGSEDDSKISFNTVVVQLSFWKYYRSRFFHKAPGGGDNYLPLRIFDPSNFSIYVEISRGR